MRALRHISPKKPPQSLVGKKRRKTVEPLLFTAGQRAVLVGIACNHNPAQAIAAQCPLSGGDAVYAARSLYASIENVVYDDPEICWAQAISLRPNAPNTPKATIAKTDLVSQKVKVYPNPAYHFITIEVENITVTNNAKIVITDILGKLVYDSGNTLFTNKFTISTLPYNSGVYALRLYDGEQLVHTEKIVIIK